MEVIDKILNLINQKISAKIPLAISLTGITIIVLEYWVKLKLDEKDKPLIYGTLFFTVLTILIFLKKIYDVLKKPTSKFIKKIKCKIKINNLSESEIAILAEFCLKGEDVMLLNRSDINVQSLVHKGIIMNTGVYSGSILYEKTHRSYKITSTYKSIVQEKFY